jgi:hypothetical protein
MQARERTIGHQAELVPKNFESEGREFESLRARHSDTYCKASIWYVAGLRLEWRAIFVPAATRVLTCPAPVLGSVTVTLTGSQ